MSLQSDALVMAKRTTTEVEIESKHLTLSNLEKVLYPEVGFTKAQVIDYYVRIAPVLLPHLRDRPLTMKRYPEGVEGGLFYQKNCPTHRPPWVTTAPVWSEGNNRWMDYCLVQDVATLVWAANLADIELHTSLSLAKEILRPTMIVFDLDPGEPATIVQCCQAGIWVRDIFSHFGLQAFPKTSGSKGLQVYVPLNTPVTYNDTKPFAHELARLLEDQHREQIVSDMKKVLRVGKVFVDWSQNDDHKTTVCVYSLRAKQRPTVSTPVTWKEVEQCWAKKDANLLVFQSDQVLQRVERMGDLFEPVLTLKQKLPPLDALRALRDGGAIGMQAAAAQSKPAAKNQRLRTATPRRAAPRRKAAT
ncbi:MAG TPA: non-homologous end-joining DNA ligase [Terriglobales bacterium]|nr:non-homologous end-joining DNA ligase [Terriglobales bacterium]